MDQRADETPPVLELRHVSKHFGGAVALQDVDFALRTGTIHGLLGENGAGKSTLVKIFSGVHTEYAGEMLLGGQPVHFRSPADAKAAGIGMVYQELSVFKPLTVAENILSASQPLDRLGLVDWRAMNRIAREHLDALGLNISEKMTVDRLSVGMQQMVEIARVLFSGARIIILDEPTSALSPLEAERLFEFMFRLRDQGRTLILITHFIEDALRVCDQITILKNARKVATLDNKGLSKQDVIHMMIGTDAKVLEESYLEDRGAQRPQRAVESAVLEVRNLGKRGAFHDVSFDLHRGEILGLYGFMGAGPADIAKCLFGCLHFEAGEVLVGGKPARFGNPVQAKKAGLAFVPENRRTSLHLGEPIFKNISLAHLERMVGWLLRPRVELEAARQQIDRLSIRPNQPLLKVGSLSGGNQQKVVLAKWLTYPPKVLVMVEPTRGMDVGAKAEVIQVMRRLRDEGVAILLVSAEPETVMLNSDRIIVFSRGHVTKEFAEGEEVTKAALMRYAS